ncbi:MAG: valine--tRNA ligase, partial [Sphingobacteriaceae bacterium]
GWTSSRKLVWDDFCAWYLEMIKPAYQQPADRKTYTKTIYFFENILKILHPFMPFITEELWHDELFGDRDEKDSCIVAQLPTYGEFNTRLLAGVEVVKLIVTQIRNIRNNKKISPKEALSLSIKVNSGINYKSYNTIITKLANISELTEVTDKVDGAISFLAQTDEFFIPFKEDLDVVAETERLQKERDYIIGFIKSVDAKLSNERFIQNAKPEIIETERRKKADAEAKLAIILKNLEDLAG